jgi:hypothetical protein
MTIISLIIYSRLLLPFIPRFVLQEQYLACDVFPSYNGSHFQAQAFVSPLNSLSFSHLVLSGKKRECRCYSEITEV